MDSGCSRLTPLQAPTASSPVGRETCHLAGAVETAAGRKKTEKKAGESVDATQDDWTAQPTEEVSAARDLGGETVDTEKAGEAQGLEKMALKSVKTLDKNGCQAESLREIEAGDDIYDMDML